MGRPKLYADRAEKMRAYRARRAVHVVTVDKPTYEMLQEDLLRLRAAVVQAAAAGDTLAGTLKNVSPDDALLSLIAHFEAITSVVPVAVPVAALSAARMPPAADPALSRSDRKKQANSQAQGSRRH